MHHSGIVPSPHHNEVTKKLSKASFNYSVSPNSFHEGDIILFYDVSNEALGLRNLDTLWKGPYILKNCILKGLYNLSEPDRKCLKDLVNKLYLKMFCS